MLPYCRDSKRSGWYSPLSRVSKPQLPLKVSIQREGMLGLVYCLDINRIDLRWEWSGLERSMSKLESSWHMVHHYNSLTEDYHGSGWRGMLRSSCYIAGFQFVHNLSTLLQFLRSQSRMCGSNNFHRNRLHMEMGSSPRYVVALPNSH